MTGVHVEMTWQPEDGQPQTVHVWHVGHGMLEAIRVAAEDITDPGDRTVLELPAVSVDVDSERVPMIFRAWRVTGYRVMQA